VQQIAIYGCGGFGREAAWLLEACNEAGAGYQNVGFIDDDPALQGSFVNGLPVFSLEEAARTFPGAQVVAGVGSPTVREALVARIAAHAFVHATLVHPRVERSRWIEIGEGSVVCAGTILTTNVRLGKHVQVNPGCIISHDSVLEDYASLAPGVHISGFVHLGRRAYVGAGAVIINGSAANPLVIGADVIVGAGACVTKPVEPGLTVVGVPARPIEHQVESA
jgi:sugar O-acyltransferase (sialic acid O-acetyltransferase NeuD family)